MESCSKRIILACLTGAISLTFVYGYYSFSQQKSKFLRSSIRLSNAPTAVIVIHGGAGRISKSVDPKPYYEALQKIIFDSYNFSMKKDVHAVDVVEYAVIQLENHELFNAGKGAVYTSVETHELEASIMDGATLNCGAVSMVKNVKNPISLARVVMENTSHVYVASEETVAKLTEQYGLEKVDDSYFHTEKRLEQLRIAKKSNTVSVDHNLEKGGDKVDMPGGTGTVGCVCYLNGHVAAATSTGGLTNKMPGRIGDTPIIGAGTYANDKAVAVSSTGKGEEFIRNVVAYDVAARMLFGKRTLFEAAKETVHETLAEGTGGLIAVDNNGNYAMEFNSGGMLRAKCDSNGLCTMSVWDEEISFSIIDGRPSPSFI
jgi:beta-aspartyl-peptidase (threonine type)